MEQIGCFSRKRNIPDLGGTAPFGAVPAPPAGPARTDEWGLLIGQNWPENSGKQGKQLFSAAFLSFILFKGRKGGKSDGFPALPETGRNCQNCRLGPPEPAGTRKTAEKEGKQLFFRCFRPFPARSGGPTRQFWREVTKGHQKVTFLSGNPASFYLKARNVKSQMGNGLQPVSASSVRTVG